MKISDFLFDLKHIIFIKLYYTRLYFNFVYIANINKIKFAEFIKKNRGFFKLMKIDFVGG